MSRLRTAVTLGGRFALRGREAVARTAMTAVGVGLGVALLLLAASVPNALATRDARASARNDVFFDDEPVAGVGTLLVGDASTSLGDRDVRGRLLEPDGPAAPVPPGVTILPAAGEMLVSPALGQALRDPAEGALRARLPYRVAGTVGDEGLLGPRELAFYAGDDRLVADRGGLERRIDHFGDPIEREPLDPLLSLLVLVGVLVLLLPVVVFVATATRFGAERRDRRLAALRLVGMDAWTARGVAAGEAFCAALLGVVVGAVAFTSGRRLLTLVSVQGVSVFPGDARPAGWLVVGVALLVPLLSVAVTLAGLRGVVIEPLGVVRHAPSTRRRLWWRLALPATGLALLLPAIGSLTAAGAAPDVRRLGAGTLLLLSGSVVLLPWLVDAVVRGLDGGPVPWQLAVRRLQLTGATSARVAGGVAVAAAGTIALQMLFSGLAVNYQTLTGEDPSRADLVSTSFGRSGDQLTAVPGTIERVAGVRQVLSTAEIAVGAARDPSADTTLIVGDCAALAQVAIVGECSDGDVFLSELSESGAAVVAGARVVLEDGSEWTVPASAATVDARPDPVGQVRNGILATRGALDVAQLDGVRVDSYLLADVATPGVLDGVVTALVSLDPLAVVRRPQATDEVNRFSAVRTGLSIGALLTLLMIGASLLVSGLEQLAQRRRVLAALAAVGTPRSTLAWSLLLQTAIPVLLGMALAAVMGAGLGAVLLAVASTPLRFDPLATAGITGLAAAVVLGVTAALLPGLRRSMRPDGLWSE